jgi:type II secretory pathway pseudopilin PulG
MSNLSAQRFFGELGDLGGQATLSRFVFFEEHQLRQGMTSPAMIFGNPRSGPGATPRSRAAFSLMELIMVIAIMVILAGLLVPAVNSLTVTAGRKGALNTLMTTFEQARAAALESGANVYIVFWQRSYPEKDSLIVLREPVEWKKEEAAYLAKGRLIPISKYIHMPKGVLLYGGKGKNVFTHARPDGNSPNELADLLKQMPKTGGAAPDWSQVGYVKFLPTGVIAYPDKDHSRLIVSEGVRDENGTETLIADRKNKHGGFEVITFRRFTGRASLEVSTIE